MAGNASNAVTCAERVKMNAIAGLIFILAGDGLILMTVMGDGSGAIGSALTCICGIAAVLLGFYYMLCFFNKAVSVSTQAIVYRNWMGRTTRYAWKDASVSFHPGRNAYFIFELAGKKVKFYGYANNAQELFDFLFDNELFDNDTMEILRKAKEKEDERIREMQRKSREREAALEAEFDED